MALNFQNAALGPLLTLLSTTPQVAQQTLQALAMLVSKEPDAIRPYANSIIPLVVSTASQAPWMPTVLPCNL